MVMVVNPVQVQVQVPSSRGLYVWIMTSSAATERLCTCHREGDPAKPRPRNTFVTHCPLFGFWLLGAGALGHAR